MPCQNPSKWIIKITKCTEEIAKAIRWELDINFEHYSQWHLGNSREKLLEDAAQYLMHKRYTLDVVDVCLQAAPNALGINVTVYQNSQRFIKIAPLPCTNYYAKDAPDVYLVHFHAEQHKNHIMGHFNAIVNNALPIKHVPTATYSIPPSVPEVSSTSSHFDIPQAVARNSKSKTAIIDMSIMQDIPTKYVSKVPFDINGSKNIL